MMVQWGVNHFVQIILGDEDEGGELAGEDVSQRLHSEGEVLDEVIAPETHTKHKRDDE